MSDQVQLEEYLERLTNDFDYFLEQLWLAVNLPTPALHQRQIAQWLQHGPKRRGVRAFRGAAKTWVTLAYCIWRLFRDQNQRILLVSKSEKHSKDSLYMARKWIGQVPFLQHMVPDRIAGQRDSALNFDIRQAPSDRTPSFTAASITGQITGSRATLIISDDVETTQTTLTLDMRTRLREEVKEFDNILIPGGDVVFLGTNHHVESLYTKLAEDAGYAFRSWPAQYPGGDWAAPPDLAPELQEALDRGEAQPDDSVWPSRFNIEELIDRQASEGRSTYGMQYAMLQTLGDELKYPLKLQDLIVFPVQRDRAPLTIAWGMRNDRGGSTRYEEIPSLGFAGDGFYSPIMFSDQWVEYTGTYAFIDPSGKGADKTAVAIVAHLNGFLYVKAVKAFQGGFERETLEGICLACREHRVDRIHVEDNFGSSMFTALLEPVLQGMFLEPDEQPDYPDGWTSGLENVRVHGQKEVRIISCLEPLANSHRLVFHPDVAHNQDLQRQWTMLTRERNCLKHDDEIDALGSCCAQWLDLMNMDPEVAANNRRSQWLEDALDEHYAAFKINRQTTSWIRRRD
jgi:hypothetical protein